MVASELHLASFAYTKLPVASFASQNLPMAFYAFWHVFPFTPQLFQCQILNQM